MSCGWPEEKCHVCHTVASLIFSFALIIVFYSAGYLLGIIFNVEVK